MIRERILKYIDYKGISKYKFYQETGLSNGFLDKNGAISSDNCEKISYVYDDLDLIWLITGKGEMIKTKDYPNVLPQVEESTSYIAKRRNMKNTNVSVKKDMEYQGVPIYNVPIDASFLERFRDEAYYEPIGFLNLPKLRNCDFAAVISGNSMYPLMKSGSIVVCRIVNANLNTDGSYFDEGEMYFVSTVNGFETVKYVQSSDKPDELLLIPHNEKIRPTTIKKSNVIRMCIVEAWLNFR